MPKTATLLIRFTPEDRARLEQVAAAHFLDMSTWARQALLRAMEEAGMTKPPRPPQRTAKRKTG